MPISTNIPRLHILDSRKWTHFSGNSLLIRGAAQYHKTRSFKSTIQYRKKEDYVCLRLRTTQLSVAVVFFQKCLSVKHEHWAHWVFSSLHKVSEFPLWGETHMTSALGGGRGVPQKQTKADEGGRGVRSIWTSYSGPVLNMFTNGKICSFSM